MQTEARLQGFSALTNIFCLIGFECTLTMDCMRSNLAIKLTQCFLGGSFVLFSAAHSKLAALTGGKASP